MLYGAPRGSVLGPNLFLLYSADLIRPIEQYGLQPHLYTNDTQIYGACSPSTTRQLQQRTSACTDDVAIWMRSNRLQPNTAKTEVLLCASNRRQQQLPQTSFRVGTDEVALSRSVSRTRTLAYTSTPTSR
jgi:hypothetical protein